MTKVELREIIEDVIANSTDWHFNGEDELEEIDAYTASYNIIAKLEELELIKLTE